MPKTLLHLLRVVPALVAGLALGCGTPAQAQAQATAPATPLFGAAPEASLSRLDRPARLRLGRMQRVRFARAFSSKLATSTRLQLDMFANWKGVARRTRFEKRPDGLLWAGQIEGDRLSSVLFVVRKGKLTGHLSTNGGDFTIQSVAGASKGATARGAGQDLIAISQPEIPGGDWCGQRRAPAALLSAQPSPLSGAGASGRAVVGAAADETTIDVMFAYTPQAKAASPDIEADLRFTIEDANQIFANSQLPTRLRLVHSALVEYTDSGSLSTDLNRVTSQTDGIMDNVHQLRDSYGADLVCFVPASSQDGYAGLAWIMGGGLEENGGSVGPRFEGLGFSTVTGDQLLWAFAHEIGHNMGSTHDHVQEPNGYSAFPYSYGHINPDKGFFTIMAYTTACDNIGKFCRRVQWFSNPDLSQDGAPTGVPEGQTNAADNRKTFTITTPIVANFRSSRASIILAANILANEGTESPRSLSINISRQGPIAQALTLSYSFENLTATNGVDYTGTPGTVTFAAGQANARITIPITPDAIYEGNETFVLNVTGEAAQVLGPARAVITIVDDDNPRLSITGSSMIEGSGAELPQLAFKLTLDGPQARESQVTYTTRDGTAQAGTDYYPVSSVATIPAGQTETTIFVSLRSEEIAEADETFELVLSNPVNVDIGVPSAVGTIQNDDLPAITLADTTARESSGVATFTATLSVPWPQEISVGYATAGGTAAEGDFTAVSGRISWAPGQVTQTISVPLLDDLVVEPEELFALRLVEARGGRIVDGDANAIIGDDDLPGLRVSDAQEVEGDGLGTITRYLIFTVTLDVASSRTLAVGYTTRDGSAVAGSDYDAVSGTVSFVPGQTSAQVLVPLRGDLQVENAEDLQLVLLNPDGVRIARDIGVGTIQSDDVPALSISDSIAREATGGSTALFTVSLSNAWPTPISVAFRTTSGTGVGTAVATDFTSQTGRLSFAPGQTTQTIAVRVLDDAIFEEPETFNVILSEALGGRIEDGEGKGTITSNDALPAISIDAAKKLEGLSGLTFLEFPLRLSGASSQSVSVTYNLLAGTAAANSDFRAATGEVVLKAGAVGGVIRVAIIGDRVIEKDEIFTVVLSRPVGARLLVARATGTIQNDDRDQTPPTVSIQTPRGVTVSGAWPAASGLATDATRLSRVSVRLQRLLDGRYWNGSAWVAGSDPRTSFNAVLSGTAQSARWSTKIAPSALQTQSGAYRLTATALDAENNKAEASATFSMDRSGPVLSIANPRDKTVLRTLALVSGTAVDAPAGVAKVELSIQRKSDNRYWNGRDWVVALTRVPATLSGRGWRVSGLPTKWAGGTHIFTARATDKVGNVLDKSVSVTFVSSPAT